jgi:hypothetical protein
MDMTRLRAWVYHPEHEPKMIYAEEAEQYYKDGWYDTPAAFTPAEDFGVDPDDELAVQGLGETIKGVVDHNNGALNLKRMRKEDLAAFSTLNYGETLDPERLTKAEMISAIERFMSARSESEGIEVN